jgi:hypothetical protein
MIPSNLENMVIGMLVESPNNGRSCLRRKVDEGQSGALLWTRETMSRLEIASAVPDELLDMIIGSLVVEPGVRPSASLHISKAIMEELAYRI